MPIITLFTGPSGSGKTTVLYKYALEILRNRNKTPLVIAANSYNIGSQNAVNKVSSYAGFECKFADFSSGLINELEQKPEADHFLIDIPGINTFDEPKIKILKKILAAISDIEVSLVLNICSDSRQNLDYLDFYHFTAFKELIFSFVDLKTGEASPDKQRCLNTITPELSDKIEICNIKIGFSAGDRLPGVFYI